MSDINYAAFKNRNLFAGLDGLRFFSIITVVWHHSVGAVPLLPATRFSFLGVDLFFVISGFLIVTLLLRENDLKGVISLKSFYIRRSLRIFPLYYGFLLALTMFYLFVNKDSEYGKLFISELPIYFFYLANFFPTSIGILWSLASEEQFYLIWPFLEKYFRKYIMFILLTALAINQFINFNINKIAQWLNAPELLELEILQATFTPILLGVALAHILHNRDSFNRFQQLLASPYSSLLWFGTLIVVCTLMPDDLYGFPRVSIQILMMLLVGSVVVNEETRFVEMLKWPAVARLGIISYGIYIFHIQAIVVAEKLLNRAGPDSRLAIFVLGFGISVLAAEFSYRLFESPILRLKSKFSVVHQKHA